MANSGNIRDVRVNNVPKVGNPRVVLGTLHISVPSIVRFPFVSNPAVGLINLNGFGISSDQQKFGIPSFYATSQALEVHTQVEFQLPEFIREDHRQFIAFIKEYYKYNEKSEGPLHYLRRLLQLQNIDQTTEELLEFFHREYSPSFPRNTALSPAVIIKNIKQFYLAKGTEKSFRFLFKVFFGSDIDFYYPRLDILRFSDGKWIQDRTIKCVLLQGDATQLRGNRIIGAKSKASAFVERVLITQEGSITVHELFLNSSSIVGKFDVDELVRDESGAAMFRVLPMVSSIKITKAGQGYKEGQDLIIAGEGFNCKARINSVSEIGQVESVQIYQFGAGYRKETTSVVFPQYDGVSEQASGYAVFDSIVKYPGYFLNSDGTFSSLKKIQDGYYYQQFSYVIKAPESRNRYENIVKQLVHPAGFIFFSEVDLESQLDVAAIIPPDLNGNVAAETEMFTDLRLDYNEFNEAILEYVFQELPFDIEDVDVERFTEDVTYGEGNVPLGPNWNDWDKWKTDYRPTPVFGQPLGEILQPGYYNRYANTPLKAFADVKLSDISQKPLQQIEHLPETTVTQEGPAVNPPTQLIITSGNNQTAFAGSTLDVELKILALDDNDEPVANVAIEFAVTSGGGSIAEAVTTTNASGVATLRSWTLGPTAGVNTVSAKILNSTPEISVTLTVTAVFGSLFVYAPSIPSEESVGHPTVAETSVQAGELYGWGWYDSSIIFGVPPYSTNGIYGVPTHLSMGIWKDISCGPAHALGLKADDTLWVWGAGGLLGQGTGPNSFPESAYVPVEVVPGTTWKSFAAGQDWSVAIKSDGTLWEWGNQGGYGRGDLADRYLHQVGADNDWESVYMTTMHSFARKTDGSWWGWNRNAEGQLGIPSILGETPITPVPVPNSSDWKSVHLGGRSTVVIKNDGTAWGIGWNHASQLGSAGQSSTDVPIQIGTDNTWTNFAVNSFNVWGIKADGTLWACGQNVAAIGLDPSYPPKWDAFIDPVTNTTTFTQIGTDTDWEEVYTNDQVTGLSNFAYVIAKKKDGTLWAWGWNNAGIFGGSPILGDGTTIPRNAPVQISPAKNWIKISLGNWYQLAVVGA